MAIKLRKFSRFTINTGDSDYEEKLNRIIHTMSHIIINEEYSDELAHIIKAHKKTEFLDEFKRQLDDYEGIVKNWIKLGKFSKGTCHDNK